MKDSIKAYNVKSRVDRYDADMDVAHPNRSKMVAISLAFMPFDKQAPLRALDLGVGTGFFTKKFLDAFPHAHVVALDGAVSMIDCAKARLNHVANAVDFVVADFMDLDKVISATKPFDVAFSSFSLHHLTIKEKISVSKMVLQLLKPNGLFFNADCIVGETPALEKRFQELRVEGIVDRADKDDERFKTFASTRSLLDRCEAAEKDNPIKVSEELKVLSAAGFKDVGILWKEYRESVVCGTT